MSLVTTTEYNLHVLLEHLFKHFVLLFLRHLFDLIERPFEVLLPVIFLVTFTASSIMLLAKVSTLVVKLAAEAFHLMHDILVQE